MLDRKFTAGRMTATMRRLIVTLPRRTGLPACTASECGAGLGRDHPRLRVIFGQASNGGLSGSFYAPPVVPEAELKQTDLGLVPQGEGWFIVNARDVSWIRSEERGQDTDFEGRQEWAQLGFRIQIISPGQRGLYHGERGQEDFLVVSGECVAVIEGEERHLKAWDFFHSPPWTKHTFVGAGDGPCVIVMAGSRAGGFDVVYAVNEVAAKHDASVLEETSNPDEAYARFGPEDRTSYVEGWLP